MFKYIGKRLLQFIPVFIGVTLILFVLQNVVPGDPIKLIAGEKALTLPSSCRSGGQPPRQGERRGAAG